jgi:hypothetical protein
MCIISLFDSAQRASKTFSIRQTAPQGIRNFPQMRRTTVWAFTFFYVFWALYIASLFLSRILDCRSQTLSSSLCHFCLKIKECVCKRTYFMLYRNCNWVEAIRYPTVRGLEMTLLLYRSGAGGVPAEPVHLGPRPKHYGAAQQYGHKVRKIHRI